MAGFSSDNYLPKAGKKGLLAINAVLWAIPGIIICKKGVQAYLTIEGREKILFLAAGSLITLIFFLFIFTKVTRKYAGRILRLQNEKNPVYMIMDAKGYILFTSMIVLGTVLKSINGIPAGFFASFYCGLGPALLYAAILFCCKIRTLAQ